MKPTIDLTETRDFRGEQISDNSTVFGVSITDRIRGGLPPWIITVKTIPWKLKTITTDDDLTDFKNSDRLFPTGSRKDILHQLSVKSALDDSLCDCCGAPINRYPWGRRWGLCSKCSDRLEETFGGVLPKATIPWETTNNIITVR